MVYELPELNRATSNFAHEMLIGEGGFGKVFRGALRGTQVAIKVRSEVGLAYA